MPWVRIDENAMDHPKIGGLPDGAFRLWVQGLAYCQKYLTDGLIAVISLRGLRAYSPKRRAALTEAGLWDATDDGAVQVHDYLDWNESREHVLMSRQFARERMAKLRGCSRELPSANERDPHHTTPHHTTSPTRSDKPNGETVKRTARLAFDGKILEVPKFLDDEFVKRLNGQYFDLTQFYLDLDARLDKSGDSWDLRWIREQFASVSPQPERVEREIIVTAKEAEQAAAWRRAVGGCRHEPRCESREDCVIRFVRSLRGQKVSAKAVQAGEQE